MSLAALLALSIGLGQPRAAVMRCTPGPKGSGSKIPLARRDEVTTRLRVIVHTNDVVNRFMPNRALGAGLDGHEHGDIAKIFQPRNIRSMATLGLQPVTYRLRTELGVEAWHWNPKGAWSDPIHREGYWLSDPEARGPINVSYGYRLPRRGDTVDQANNRGYSRLDDGDPATYWKSNPYLDEHFTHDPNAEHPQWIVIDFGAKAWVNELRIDWAAPYATKFRVEYWNGEPRVDEVDPAHGEWVTFPNGQVAGGKGGRQRVVLSAKPIGVQYVRIWLQTSSLTSVTPSKDIRDRVGFAIREIALGRQTPAHRFHDVVIHRRDGAQTEMIVSSTDPWHRERDRDRDVEQPGFDLIERSGLTFGLPMLVPVPVLYGVPEDAGRELRWFRSRGYSVRALEMGEEPDGQMANPEDYAALYHQAALSIHHVMPKAVLGGPSLQTTQHEFRDWPDRTGAPWLVRFLSYLRRHGLSRELGFFSFEWYPFDDVAADPFLQLASHQALFAKTVRRLEAQGLSHAIPWMITEYGFSAFAGPSEVELAGALLNADIVGEFLSMGGDDAFLYGYEPGEVIREKTGAFGNLMALLSSRHGPPIRLPTYYSAWLASHVWCAAANRGHDLLRTEVLGAQAASVGAYSLRRPDGRVAMMLVNRTRGTPMRLEIQAGGAEHEPAIIYRYGTAQYAWKPAGTNGHPVRSLPPARGVLRNARTIELPPCSLTVVVLG